MNLLNFFSCSLLQGSLEYFSWEAECVLPPNLFSFALSFSSVLWACAGGCQDTDWVVEGCIDDKDTQWPVQEQTEGVRSFMMTKSRDKTWPLMMMQETRCLISKQNASSFIWPCRPPAWREDRFYFRTIAQQLEPEITHILVKLWNFFSALISPSSPSSR